MTNELKPCPFCGGEDICIARNYEGQWRIVCANCVAIVWAGDTRNEVSVRDAWNRRVSDE
jgi:Lar family restriction alleviation protein